MGVVKQPMTMPGRRTSPYPAPYNSGFEARNKRALTEALGLTQFGVNVTTLEVGAKSSERHWHQREDEFIFVLEGVVTLVSDAGEEELGPGMAAGFKAGEPNGHHLVNKGKLPATYLEVGTRSADDHVEYPDADLVGVKTGGRYSFRRKNGDPYP